MVDSLDGIVASQEHGWAAFLLPRSLCYSTQPFLQRTKVRAREARGHLLLSSITLFPCILPSERNSAGCFTIAQEAFTGKSVQPCATVATSFAGFGCCSNPPDVLRPKCGVCASGIDQAKV
jgi:hypothetical protein